MYFKLGGLPLLSGISSTMSSTAANSLQVEIWNGFVPPTGFLAGCLLSAFFLGIVTVQTARFWEVFRQDKTFNVSLVLSLLTMNASGCLAFSSVCYIHLISAFGDPSLMARDPPVDWRYLYGQSVGLATTFVVLITLTIPIFSILKSRLLSLLLDALAFARTGLGFYQIYVFSQEAERLGSLQVAQLLKRVTRASPILIVLSDVVVAAVLCGLLLFARGANPINDSAINRLIDTLLPCSIFIILWQLGVGISIWTNASSVAVTFAVSSPLLFNIAYLATLHARSQLTSPGLLLLNNPLRWAFAKRKVEPWSTAITITQERVQQTEEGTFELGFMSQLSLRPEEREVIEYYRAR
ncbi:hypothetical protein DL93DRAFT_2222912 [Clavulina sp. PMI_390]|nr:hypothetical protein DL93DRAFT_2222912 [Clavulina sp. PMI_390]